MIILFIGASGSGKDTQANLLKDKMGFKRVSTGDLIRSLIEGENEVKNIVRAEMNKGFLEDDFVFGILKMYLKNQENENIILSGVVRRYSQISLLDKALNGINKSLGKVLYFELSDIEAEKRMAGRVYCPNCNANFHTMFNPPKKENICDVCGSELKRRPDDFPEAIKERLKAFHKDNDAIIEEYEKRGILIRIDAAPSIELIHKEVLNKVKND